MANDRLTWQNVDAPDFSGAAQSAAIAGRLFGDGFGSISDTLAGRQGRQNEIASAEALAAAQRFTDPAAWDKAMREQGIEGALGVRPGQLTPDALKALGSRGEYLLGNANTAAGTASTISATANAVDANSRANLESQNSDRASDFNFEEGVYSQGRARAADVLTDEGVARKKEATDYVDRTAYESIDPVGARQSIINDRNLTPEQRAAYLAEFDAQAPLLYTADQNALDKVTKIPEVAKVSESLGIYQNDRLFKNGANPDLATWTDAQSKFGTAESPLKTLLTGLNDLNGKLQSEGGVTETTLTTSAGKVSRIFEDAKKTFPNVPDAVIAGVLEDKVRSGYLLLGDGQELKVDTDSAWAVLEKFNDPVARKELEDARLQNAGEDKAISTIKADLGKVSSELALAISKGLPQSVIDAKMDEIRAIEQKAAKVTGAKLLADGSIPQSVKDALQISGSAAVSGSGVASGAGGGNIGAQVNRNAAMAAAMEAAAAPVYPENMLPAEQPIQLPRRVNPQLEYPTDYISRMLGGN